MSQCVFDIIYNTLICVIVPELLNMCASFVNVCDEAKGTSNLGYLMHVQLVLVLVPRNQRNNCCTKSTKLQNES